MQCGFQLFNKKKGAGTLALYFTLSVEKIPVVLRPVILLPVKNMAPIGTQEKSGNLGIISIFAKF